MIPQISVIMGPCAGGAVYSPAITDFIFMVKETSHMFITGPDVIKTVTGEETDVRGARRRDDAQLDAPASPTSRPRTRRSCLEDVRYLFSFLPQNNLEIAPRVQPSDDPMRMDEELDTIVPDNANKPYDMRDVVHLVVDDGEFLEVHEHFAQNIIVGYARLNGYAVGVVGNQPKALAGVLDIEASEKAARFVRTLRRVQHPDPHVRATFRASFPARRRSGTGSSATAPSCCTRSPRRRCRRSRSSRARPTAAPTTS